MAKKVKLETLYSQGRAHVGKRAVIEFHKAPVGKIDVAVRVKDFKTAYGNPRYLVEPIAGKGEMWVQNLSFAH